MEDQVARTVKICVKYISQISGPVMWPRHLYQDIRHQDQDKDTKLKSHYLRDREMGIEKVVWKAISPKFERGKKSKTVRLSVGYISYIIPRSHSYCLSLPLCLVWYNGSITPRLHSGVAKPAQCRLRPIATVGISVLNNCQEWDKFVRLTHLSHSRQWFNIHLTDYHTINVYQPSSIACGRAVIPYQRPVMH